MAIAIIHSDAYLEHDTGEHPERIARYRAVMNGLTADHDFWESLIKIAPSAATEKDILRCHSQRVIARIGQACRQASAFDQVALDPDTLVSPLSDTTARLAAGGACRAVDAVVNGQAKSAFVACRPPGHHATASASMGFCLYNSAAIAARYAQATYPEQIKRVLIVDFDVHHGNGTQDIFYRDPTVFYYSLHQYPWYPGTGTDGERGLDKGEGFTLNVPVMAMTPLEEYLTMFEAGLEAILKTFTPDLIIISAGFDAHESDPLGQLRLTNESYRRMTKRLKEATVSGRVVSCLEGGYNLQTLGGTAHAHVSALG